MRRLLIALLFCFPLILAAQDSTSDKLYRAYISIAQSQPHGKFVLFTNNYVEETNPFFSWLFNEGHCASLDEKEGISHIPKKVDLDLKRTDYGYHVSLLKASNDGTDESKISIQYFLKKNDKISKVVISGKWDAVVDIFIRYWNLSYMKLSKSKRETAYYTALNDRVSLTGEFLKDYAVITITNNAGNDILEQYRK